MQGRITKVINMKPPETLGMIEEAAGTRMYENKKAVALRTLEKKQNKVDEINRLLSEEITPTLQKLQRERENYMRWVRNNNDIDMLSRFCIAYEYIQAKTRLDSRNNQLEEMETESKQLTDGIKNLDKRDAELEKEIKELTKTREKQQSSAMGAAEQQHGKLSKELTAAESKAKNSRKAFEADKENSGAGNKQVEALKKTLEKKAKAVAAEAQKTEKIVSEAEAAEKEVEKTQWTMQALSAGVSANKAEDGEQTKSLSVQLLATQTRISEMDGEEKRKVLSIAHLKEQIAAAEAVASKSKKDGGALLKEKGSIEDFIQDAQKKINGMKFDPARYKQLEEAAWRDGASLQDLQDRVNGKRAVLSAVDFRYQDPERNFDRSKVKGVVAKLFQIKPEHADYTMAVQVAAGGKLWHVVVDNEQTGKALLTKGQLRRRVTIIPLNKIVSNSQAEHVFSKAERVAGKNGEVLPALQVIGAQREVEAAMKFVFGNHLVCDTPETAKKVTFHPEVRVKSVTKKGDVYDPSGMLTGGSAPKGGNILQQLQELADLEEQLQRQHETIKKHTQEREKLQASWTKYSELERALTCKQHELQLINERIQGSEHQSAVEEKERMKANLAQLETDLKAMPDEKKKLQKEVKQLEKDMSCFESGREERLKQLEKDVEKQKVVAKKRTEELLVQREKQDKLDVELEAMKAELENAENAAADTSKQNAAAEAEVVKLEESVKKFKVLCDEAAAKLEKMRAELVQADEQLASLTQELKEGRRIKEEKELELKKVGHRIAQFHKDHKETNSAVANMEKQHAWIIKEKDFFGKPGTDFDFENNNYSANKKRLESIKEEQKHLSKSINKKAMTMFDRAEVEYKDLLEKRDTVLNDKSKIEKVIKDLDLKKEETLKRTWVTVNKHLGSIFSTLLPNTFAKLEPPQGMSEVEGLELKVAFNGVWKQSLTELSGGQRSLLALSLVLALLLFKPAPMYILDEIDSALDLSHTQNIGHMIRQHFPHSQFIIVSLKEGMFNNANVLFKTRFVDGCSTVTRYAIREGSGVDKAGEVEEKESKDQVQKGKKRKAVTQGQENNLVA